MLSSSEQATRRSLKIVVVFLVAALVIEFAVRAIERRLPEPLVWHTVEAQNKVRQMDQFATRGGASVAVLGTSVVISGINPDIIDAAIGGRQRVYNTALASGVPALMDPWTTGVVIPRLRPSLLVLGVTSYDLSDDKQGIDFTEAFLSSPGGRRVTGSATAIDNIDWWLRRHLSIWNDRISLRDPNAVFDAIRGDAPPLDHEVAFTTPSGWISFSDSFTPVLRVKVDQWKIGTRNVAALQELLQTARAKGIKVAIVDMPVTNEYIAHHPNGEADYVTFRTALRDIAARTGALALEFDSMRDHRYFFDEVHLNELGATVLTRDLVAALEERNVLPPA